MVATVRRYFVLDLECLNRCELCVSLGDSSFWRGLH